MVSTLPLQFGIPGGPELLVILLIAVLLFGANKIPKLARSTGEAMGEFQKGREEVEQELQEMREGGSSSNDDVSATSDREGSIDADESPIESNPEIETESEVETDENVEIAEAEAEEETNR